jgi:uncharacterized oxidoreductase
LGNFNVEDMKGVSIAKVDDMVRVAVKGMQTDRFEIRPGQSNLLKMMSRVAPGCILNQMSRSVDRMLRTQLLADSPPKGNAVRKFGAHVVTPL